MVNVGKNNKSHGSYELHGFRKDVFSTLFFWVSHMSFFLNDLGHENKTGWLGYMVDYTTQLYRDYFINHYKDPY